MGTFTEDILNTCTAFADGNFCLLREANVSILDLGLVHCDATYDVCHVINGRFFRLDWHLERFYNSAAGLRLTIPYSTKELVNILRQCVIRSGIRDAFVWMICTRGTPKSGNPRDLKSCVIRFIAYAKPYYGLPLDEKSIHIIISSTVRIPPSSIDPILKSFHWGDLTQAQFEAIDRGADTAILVDLEGNVTEGPGFNIFVVLDGIVISPKRGVLQGITRRAILEICDEFDIPAKLDVLSPEDLRGAEEVFLTSTSGGITSVNRVDEVQIGNGQPGPITRKLSELYWAKHNDDRWTSPL